MLGDRNVEGGLEINYIQNTSFAVGTRVKIYTRLGKEYVDYVGIVVGDYDWFFNVEIQTENYNSFIISVNKVDLVTQYGSTKVKEVA